MMIAIHKNSWVLLISHDRVNIKYYITLGWGHTYLFAQIYAHFYAGLLFQKQTWE